MSIFSGVLFCADCGNKMHLLHACEDGSRNAYNCCSYRVQKRVGQLVVCTSHHIKESILKEIVLKDVMRVLRAANEDERAFILAIGKSNKKQAKVELATEKREIRAAETRIDELNMLFRKLYEDNALGKISDEQFSFLTCGFEEEKETLEMRIDELKKNAENSASHSSDLKKFITLAKKYANLTELNFENVHALIEKILIHELDKNRRVREVEIFYSGIGKVPNLGSPIEVSYYVSRCGGNVSTIVI